MHWSVLVSPIQIIFFLKRDRKKEIGKNILEVGVVGENGNVSGGRGNIKWWKCSIIITQYTNYFAQILIQFHMCVRVRLRAWRAYVCAVAHTEISSFTSSTANEIEIRNCSFVSIILFHFSIMFCWRNEKKIIAKIFDGKASLHHRRRWHCRSCWYRHYRCRPLCFTNSSWHWTWTRAVVYCIYTRAWNQLKNYLHSIWGSLSACTYTLDEWMLSINGGRMWNSKR